MVFRGESWSLQKSVSEDIELEFIVLHLLLAAVLPEPGLRLQGLTSAFIFPHTGAKNHKGKEENYIYIIIYI